MHSSLVLASLVAALAVAKPLDKRAYVTEYASTVTVTKTVYVDAMPTGEGYGYGSGYGDSSAAESSAPSGTEDAVMSESSMEESPAEETMMTTMESMMTMESTAEETTMTESPVEESTAMEYSSSTTSSEEGKPSSTEPPPAEFAAEQSSDSSGSWQDKILSAHNVHRSNHSSTGSMTWSSKLASTGQKQSTGCIMEHDNTVDKGSYASGYGQNIAMYSDDQHWGAIHRMYNEEIYQYDGKFGLESLDPNNNDYSHYTQIVWKETTEVGCGFTKCGDGMTYLFCNYSPPGNYEGEYQNVGVPLMKPSVGDEYSFSG